MGGGLIVLAGAGVLAVQLFSGGHGRPTAGASAGSAFGTPLVSPSPSSQLPLPSPSLSPTGAAADQMAAIDRLLDSSAADRQQVVDAVNNVAGCQSVAAARAALTQVADHRTQLADQLAAQPLDGVDGAPQAVADLRAAWEHSAAADRAFADWAAGAASCTTAADVTQDSAYQRGVDESAQATAAKRDFLARWNQIVPAYGLRSRAENDI